MMNSCRFIIAIGLFYEDVDADTLHDRENILVLATIGSCFFLAIVSMQVNDVYIIKATHQFTAHLTVNNPIQETIVTNVCQHTFACPLNIILP